MRSSAPKGNTVAARQLSPEQFVAETEQLLREYETSQKSFAKRAAEMAKRRGEPEHFEFMCEHMIPMSREAEAHCALSAIAEGEGLLSFGTTIPTTAELLADWKKSVVEDCRPGDSRLLFARDAAAN